MLSRVFTSSVYRNTSLRSDIYDQLDWTYHAKSILPDCAPYLFGYGLIKSATSHFVSNGRVKGFGHDRADFEIFEIHARQPELLKPNPHSDIEPGFVGFRGIVISIDHPQKFMGHTIVRRDRGKINPKQVRGLSRAGMVDLDFERRFEVYTNDQVEARYLVPPDLMERLTHLEKGYFGRNAQCAFIDGGLHIVLESDDRFCLSAPLEILDYAEAATAIMGEISSVFRVIDEIEEFQDPATGEDAIKNNEIRDAYYLARMDALKAKTFTMQDTWEADYAARYNEVARGPELGTMISGWYGWKTKPTPSKG